MEKSNLLNDIAALRCIATFSLVVWHTYCSYICWDVAHTPLNDFYSNIFTRIIPDANMPFFTIIAGYTFCYLLRERNKYVTFIPFLKNKINRLLIPFIILGTIINLCEYGKNLVDIIYGLPNHLWYCLMLFYVYIICWIIEKYFGTKTNIILTLVSFFVIYKTHGYPAIGYHFIAGVFLPIYYYGYFYFGFLLRKYKQYIINDRINIYIILALILYVFFAYFNSGYMLATKCISYFMLMLLVMNTKVIDRILLKDEVERIIKILSKYSFGIYVFHQWIIWNLTREPHCLLYIKPLLNNHYIIAPIIMVFLVYFISLMFTKFLIRTKIGQYLLL